MDRFYYLWDRGPKSAVLHLSAAAGFCIPAGKQGNGSLSLWLDPLQTEGFCLFPLGKDTADAAAAWKEAAGGDGTVSVPECPVFILSVFSRCGQEELLLGLCGDACRLSSGGVLCTVPDFGAAEKKAYSRILPLVPDSGKEDHMREMLKRCAASPVLADLPQCRNAAAEEGISGPRLRDAYLLSLYEGFRKHLVPLEHGVPEPAAAKLICAAEKEFAGAYPDVFTRIEHAGERCNFLRFVSWCYLSSGITSPGELVQNMRGLAAQYSGESAGSYCLRGLGKSCERFAASV